MKILVKIADQDFEHQTSSNSLVIGRSRRCDFCIPIESLSRKHCRIEIDQGHIFVTDLNSSNGVYVDGQKLDADQRIRYSTFLSLSLGPYACKIIDDEQKTFSRILVPDEFKKHSRIKPRAVRPLEGSPAPATRRRLLPWIAGGLLLTGLAGIGLYKIFFNEDPSLPDDTKISKVTENLVPPELPIDEAPLPSAATYGTYFSSRSCSGFSFMCLNLHLSEKHKEGISLGQKEREYFIFADPSRFTKEERFKNIVKADRGEHLIALQNLMKSHLFFSLTSKKKGVVHLLIINKQGKPGHVYRFDFTRYASGLNRNALLQNLDTAIEKGKPDLFWKDYKTYFTSASFEDQY